MRMMRTVTTRTKMRTSRGGHGRCVARARAEGGEEDGGTSTAKARRAPAVTREAGMVEW